MYEYMLYSYPHISSNFPNVSNTIFQLFIVYCIAQYNGFMTLKNNLVQGDLV